MSKDRTRNDHGGWFGRIATAFAREPNDRHALIEILRDCEKRSVLDHDALLMIEGALQVSEMQVRDIMIPRVQMITVKNDDAAEDILATVVESGHSRFPVSGDDIDEITGILLAKDLLAYFSSSGNRSFYIKDLMRPAVFVPESKRLNILLREFRSSRNHMVVVVDEYSGIAGLVTIEDVIEEIVGEIEDEYDIEEEENIKQHGRNRYTVNALTPIEEFNNYFQTEFSDEEHDTISGLILRELGHLPKRGEVLDIEGYHIKVLRADKRRVRLLRVSRLEQNNMAESDNMSS